ncbi:hypothetical protein BLIC30S_04277 [Bacillus licheniformis]
MPFVRMDLLKGRSKEELRRISRSVHQAMTEAIDVPEDDYFQVITQHDEEEFFFDPSYMNIKRTKDLIYIHITMKERPIEKKAGSVPTHCRAFAKKRRHPPRGRHDHCSRKRERELVVWEWNSTACIS